MSAFESLSYEVKSIISDMGWVSLTEIQELTIPLILFSENHVLVVSETASGKTEAAFLPILSRIPVSEFRESLKVMYISPLKALINDQFDRINILVDELGIKVTKWHGDASQSLKKKFLKKPNGIIQITPESIEGFMLNRAHVLSDMLDDLEYIVIDEIHSFVGKERGYHLQSLIHRLKKYYNKRVKIIGLSATVTDYCLFQNWIDFNRPENVAIAKQSKEVKPTYTYICHNEEDMEINNFVVNDIYDITSKMKAIIFAKSRANVEMLTCELNKISGFKKYFPHHSYISKEEREYAEKEIKENDDACIIATNTLELGIDIGDVDIVIQIGATSEVSSLQQRVGRSGRGIDSKRLLQVYTNGKVQLLKTISAIELMKNNILESVSISRKNYDYLFHQLLSICIEENGVSALKVIDKIHENPVFEHMTEESITQLINHLLDEKYLEFIASTSEFVVGINGEAIVKSMDFYSLFETPPVFEVYCSERKIGQLDDTQNKNQYSPGSTFVLAGRTWRIIDISHENKKIFVEQTSSSGYAEFSGEAKNSSNIIRLEVHSLLRNSFDLINSNDFAKLAFNTYKEKYNSFAVEESDRISYINEKRQYDLFLSNNQINTLSIILKCKGDITITIDDLGCFSCKNEIQFITILELVNSVDSLYDIFTKIEKFIYLGKYSKYLTIKFKYEIFEERFTDLEGLKQSLINFSILYV